MTFNNGKSILSALIAIGATASKIEKEALVKAAGASSPLFLKVVTYAYDPFKIFGISIAPNKTAGLAPGENKLEDPATWRVLDDLIERKLTGDAARAKVQNMVNFLDEHSSEVFRRIINKDMRAGFGGSTINKCFKGTIPEFPYMRCSLPAKSNMPKWDWTAGIITQEKADGMFANVNHDTSGFVWVTSRAGSLFPAGCLGIEGDMNLSLVASTQTHGELTVYQSGILCKREIGNGILNSLLSGGELQQNQKVVFDAWDQIPLTSVVPKGKYSIPYKTRLSVLARQGINAQRFGITSVRIIPTRVCKTKADAYIHYRELLKLGKEGIICKHPDAIWKDGTSTDQVKLKLEFEVELRVTGFLEGTPGTKTEATFGSLICQSECGKLVVGVSGFTDAKRQCIHNDRPRWLNSIIAVRANDIMVGDEITGDPYSLFLPRYVEDREDKTVADTLAEIQDQRAAALEAA